MQNNQISSEDIKKKLDVEGSGERRHLGLYIALLLLLSISVSYFVMSSNKSENVKYITAKVQMKDLVIKVSATGNIEPTNTVDVGIEVSGTITDVYADFNQHVKKGDVLARLDTSKLEYRVKRSQAALLVAKANLTERKVIMEDAKHERERGKETFKSTNGSYPSAKDMDALVHNYDRAKASYNAAKANVTQVDAQLKSDADDLKKALVRSPIDGIVLDRKIEVGQSVVSSMQIPVLFTLAEDLSKMQVVLSVDEADIGQVKEGQKVVFLVDTYQDKVFHGTIIQVRFNSVIVSGVVTYETVVDVNNSQLLLRPGMTANAEIITDVLKDTLVVPNAALRFSIEGQTDTKADGKHIWILEDNIPKSISVTSTQSDGIVTSVSADNLKEGMEVIINKEKEK